MATARNDITGDSISTRTSSDAFRDGWERIYGKKDIKEDREINKDSDLDLPLADIDKK